MTPDPFRPREGGDHPPPFIFQRQFESPLSKRGENMRRVVITADSCFPRRRDCAFALIDVTDGNNPEIVSRTSVPDHCCAFAASDHRLYCAPPGSFMVFDISNPFNPILESRLKASHGCKIVVSESEKRVYLADWNNGVLIIDIGDSKNPSIIGRMSCDGENQFEGEIHPYGVSGLAVKDRFLFASTMDYDMRQNREALYVYNIEQPRNPKWIARIGTSPCRGHGIVLKRNFAIVVGLRHTMVIDISRPDEPTIISIIDTPERFGMNPWMSGNYVYVPETAYEPNRRMAGFRILDVSNPLHIEYLSEILIPAKTASNVKVVDNVAYLACQGGLAMIDVSNPQSPYLMNLFSPGGSERIGEGIEVVDYADEVFAH